MALAFGFYILLIPSLGDELNMLKHCMVNILCDLSGTSSGDLCHYIERVKEVVSVLG
jgi:hypothetical protein